MLNDLVWVEKYRPKTFNELILNESEKTKIRELIKNPKAMPNILLVTKSPGTGKTSLAYVIRNEMGITKEDFKSMNSSDERKIDHMRELKDFCISKSFNNKVKLIHMDEFDGVLGASQDILRPIMEKYINNCKFILTANDESKIKDAISSRCTKVYLREPPKQRIAERLIHICVKENLTYEQGFLEKLIETHYPNMRNMIKALQELSPKKHLEIKDIIAESQIDDEFYKLLKTTNPFHLRKFVIENNLDPMTTFKHVIKSLMEDEELKTKFGMLYESKMAEISWVIAEYEFRMIMGSDKEVQLTAFIYKFKSVFK